MSAKRSHEWIDDIMAGRLDLQDAPSSIQSFARYFIYEAAVAVCKLESREARVSALDVLPAKIRPHVEAEVKRLWPIRRDL